MPVFFHSFRNFGYWPSKNLMLYVACLILTHQKGKIHHKNHEKHPIANFKASANGVESQSVGNYVVKNPQKELEKSF